MDELRDQCGATSRGDLARGEAMLTAQAHTLDAMFDRMAQKATRCEYLNQAETYSRLALKAQGQCRATWATLAQMKNPQPTTFVRQANIAHGPQQVNNGAAALAAPWLHRTRKMLKTNYWSCRVANGWTSERRARQAALIPTGSHGRDRRDPARPKVRHACPATPTRAEHRLVFTREFSRLMREHRRELARFMRIAEGSDPHPLNCAFAQLRSESPV